MIDPAILLTLKTKNELRVVCLLATSAEPMRLKDIVESLKTNNAIGKVLKSLVGKGLVREFVKFGITLYEASVDVKNENQKYQNGTGEYQKSVHEEMQTDFEYQVDGQQYMASVKGMGHELSRLTDAPCKVVFYDPTEPKQSMLLDKMPLDIYFDELTGRFGVHPLRLVPALLMAAIVCGEIVAIVWLAIFGF